MSVIRPRLPADPLALEAAALEGDPGQRGSLEERLAEARAAVLENPASLDIARPTLEAYDTNRPASGLFAILQSARRIRTAVDRVVVVAGGGIGPATRLLVAACCHPYHDQLSRGERGGRPRLTWLDGRSTADEVCGLLDLVAPPGRPPSDDLLDRWALVAVDAPPDDGDSLAVLQVLLAAASGSPWRPFAAVTAPASRLARLADAVGCRERFGDRATIDTPLGVLTAAGLLPAAIAGIDVVQLLKGAAAMLVRFAEAPVAVNPVLIDAAAGFTAALQGRPARRFAVDARALPALADWHRQLRPRSDADPATITRIRIDQSRRGHLMQPPLAEPTAADGLEAAVDTLSGARGSGRTDDDTAADVTIRLPRLDEHALGQLLQLLAVSAAVEERLRGAV